MANDETKNLENIIKEAIRPLKDMVEIVKQKVDRTETGKEAQSISLHLMREQQSVMNEKLDALGKDLGAVKETLKDHTKQIETLSKDVKEVQENVDATRGDIATLSLKVVGIYEKQGMYHDRNKREIDEIKTHLHLPLISDIPAI